MRDRVNHTIDTARNWLSELHIPQSLQSLYPNTAIQVLNTILATLLSFVIATARWLRTLSTPQSLPRLRSQTVTKIPKSIWKAVLSLSLITTSSALQKPHDSVQSSNTANTHLSEAIYRKIKQNHLFSSSHTQAEAIKMLFLLLEDVFADFTLPNLENTTHDEDALNRLVHALSSKLDRNQQTHSHKVPEVGAKEAYEAQADITAWLKTLTPTQQTLLDDIKKLTGYDEPSSIQEAASVVLITPGAHGVRVNDRLDILVDWQERHPNTKVLHWYVVTGHRDMKPAEHAVLRETVHQGLSNSDIENYASNENDYWEKRVEWLIEHDPRYKTLQKLPKPTFLKPGIHPELHQTHTPRATTKDNAKALADDLSYKDIPESTKIVIGVEPPFTTRMSHIFKNILHMEGIRQTVVPYHGAKTLAHIKNNTLIQKALKLDATHLDFLLLNQLYMWLVEEINCAKLAKTHKHAASYSSSKLA